MVGCNPAFQVTWADASLEPNISELEAAISPRSRPHGRFATAHVLASTRFHRAVFRVDVVVFRVYRLSTGLWSNG